MSRGMTREPAEISFYAGARADETPRSFIRRGEEYKVVSLLDERLVEGPDGSRERVFRVEVTHGRRFTLVHAAGRGFVLQEEL